MSPPPASTPISNERFTHSFTECVRAKPFFYRRTRFLKRQAVCDRVLIIHKGRIVADGNPREFGRRWTMCLGSSPPYEARPHARPKRTFHDDERARHLCDRGRLSSYQRLDVCHRLYSN